MTLRAAIVTDCPGWHGARLRQAFTERDITTEYVSLQACRLDMVSSGATVCLPGFADQLPDAVFVRGIPGGNLEQVVYCLNVLHAMQAAGVIVYNDGRAIERSVDKSFTSFVLALNGVPTPETWVTADPNEAAAITAAHAASDSPLVCKPLFGSQGKGLCLVSDVDTLPAADAVRGVWYLQRFVGTAGRHAADWRVFVVGGKAVAAMRRTADGWVKNVAQGARCQAILPEGEMRRLAERAVACLNMNYAGVDLIRDLDDKWWVIEVNSVPAWRGLQRVTSFDIAACLVDDLVRGFRTPALTEVVS